MPAIADRMGRLGTENAFKIGADIARCRARGMDILPLNLGEPDFDVLPEINAVAVSEIERNNTHYCDPAGLLSFRTAIADKIHRTRGIPVTPDRVVVVPGAKPTIGYAMQTYLDPGDDVLYPSPGFPIYESWIAYLGARPVPITLRDEREFAFSADDLLARVTERTKLIVLCSPSNPTGGVLSADDLADIAAVVRDHCPPDVRVYSDEIYDEIVFDDATHRSIASEPGMAERTVISSGMSKGYAMTGYRLGYAVLPSVDEARVFTQLNINTCSCVPPFLQEAGRAALESAEQRTFTREMVDAFQRRRDWIVPALNAIDGVECRRPKGAFYVFPKIASACEDLGVFDAYAALPATARRRTTPAGMVQMYLLYRYGVASMDRHSFGTIGAGDEHFLRLSIASSIEILREGVGRIDRAFHDPDGFHEFVRTERLWDD